MTIFDKFKKLMLYANADEHDFKKAQQGLTFANRGSLMIFTLVTMVIVGIMFVASFFFSVIESSRSSYLAAVIGSFILHLLAHGPAKGNHKLTVILMYVFIAMLMSIGIYFNTIVDPAQASVTFVVLMFATPLLFIDIPLRSCTMTIISIIAYIIMAYHTQDRFIFTYNMSLIFLYGTVSLFVTTFLMVMKVHSFVLHDKSREFEAIKALNNKLQEKHTQLEEARDEAKAANVAKTRFLFNMSHDIRTPMNAIIGFADLVEKKIDNKQQTLDYIAKIKTSGDYLLSLINNVLDMARIESGKMEVNEEFFDLLASKNNANLLFVEEAEKKNIKLSFTNNVKHRYVLLDKTKMHQIIMNLISNALKYTPEGGTVLYTFEEIPSSREGYATFISTIKDTGIGMTAEFAEHVFDLFSRERNTTISKVNGSGLGMSIVKKLTDLLGGTISIDTAPGKGTTITVTMSHPIVENPENYLLEEKKESSEISLANRRILLAEDNDLNAEIAIAILEEHGVSVERAEDGKICAEMVENAEPGYYDAILMDIQMPKLNGYGAARRIRKFNDPKKADIPILALTANAFDEDKEKAADAGMNGHLTKPINLQELLTTLAGILE